MDTGEKVDLKQKLEMIKEMKQLMNYYYSLLNTEQFTEEEEKEIMSSVVEKIMHIKRSAHQVIGLDDREDIISRSMREHEEEELKRFKEKKELDFKNLALAAQEELKEKARKLHMGYCRDVKVCSNRVEIEFSLSVPSFSTFLYGKTKEQEQKEVLEKINHLGERRILSSMAKKPFVIFETYEDWLEVRDEYFILDTYEAKLEILKKVREVFPGFKIRKWEARETFKHDDCWEIDRLKGYIFFDDLKKMI